jgi:hypothetical protein
MEFCDAAAFPCGVLGPVDFFALVRFALICAFVVILCSPFFKCLFTVFWGGAKTAPLLLDGPSLFDRKLVQAEGKFFT